MATASSSMTEIICEHKSNTSRYPSSLNNACHIKSSLYQIEIRAYNNYYKKNLRSINYG